MTEIYSSSPAEVSIESSSPAEVSIDSSESTVTVLLAEQGPPSVPNFPSTDAGNVLSLGMDGLLFYPGPTLPTISVGAKAKDASGTPGDLSFSGVYCYFCYAENSWARTAMETNYAL